jgi:hypothetical protein
MCLQYLYWQTGTDVAAGLATGTGPFFPSPFTHILNIYSYSSSETSSKYLTSKRIKHNFENRGFITGITVITAYAYRNRLKFFYRENQGCCN